MLRSTSGYLVKAVVLAFVSAAAGCSADAQDLETETTSEVQQSLTFTGCRGQGNWVCTEAVNSSYFTAHPNCTANFTCEGALYDCWDECPPPQDSELPSRWLDPHYRTYGRFSDGTSTLGYREGAPGYVAGSDIITVGKLDNNDVGPFAGLGGGSEGQLAARWAFLREANPDAVKYGFVSSLSGLGALSDQLLESMLPDVLQWEEQVGRAVYHTFIETISGQSAPYYYMKDVLTAQFEAEKSRIDGWIRGRIEELTGQHMYSCEEGRCFPHYTAESYAARVNSFVPVVNLEVANEPNMYPAMPPRLYAWYYLKYRQYTLGVLATINAERRAAGMQNAQVRMMPAGLWMMDGFPSSIRSVIDNGISAQVVATVSVRVYSDAGSYLREFMRFLRQPQYLSSTGLGRRLVISGRSFTNVVTYDPENLGNLSNFTYSYYDSLGRYVGTNLTNKPLNNRYYRIPRTWTAAPVSALVDIGNLHFYPYVGPASAQDLPTQLQGLRDLANFYASQTSTGKVWLTEIGNINSGDEKYVINEIMNPITTYLKTSVPAVSRWYWFQDRGEDVKFDQLDGLPAGGTGAYEVAWWMVGSPVAWFLSLLPGVDVTVPITASTRSDMDKILYKWRDSRPLQGLMDDGGAMRRMGQSYMQATHFTGDAYSNYIEYTEYQ